MSMNNANSGAPASNTTNETSTSSTSNPAQKLKQHVTSFLKNDGQTDTTVHETINPAVQHEHISKVQRDEEQKIIDREVHQDHYHTTAQPIRDSAQAPTTHTEQVAPVETREIQHGTDAKVKAELERERAQFKDTREVAATQHTSTQGPTIAGEHIHHHVHETIQPVINRDIRQEHIVHTTHPVHEIHENEPVKHAASVLPELNINEFQRQGGSLSGRQERTDAFQGPPRSIDDASRSGNNVLGGPGAKGSTSVTGNAQGNPSMNTASNISTNQPSSMGHTGSSNMASNQKTVNSQQFDTKAGISRTGGAVGAGGLGMGSGAGTSGVGSASTGMAGGAEHGMKSTMHKQTTGQSTTSSHDASGAGHKGSLVDKLNPMKDSTGSGNPGFMH